MIFPVAPRNILGATDEKCSLDQHLEAAGLEALKEETVETHPEGGMCQGAEMGLPVNEGAPLLALAWFPGLRGPPLE